MYEPLSPLAKIVFKFINAFPWAFPKRHRWLAEDNMSGYTGRVRQSEARLMKGSLLAGDFTWKGVSILIPFDHKQLSVVAKWMDKRRTVLASDVPYRPPHRASSILGFQSFHLGIIPFNLFSDFRAAPLFLKSKLSRFCDVNTVYLPNGAAYLSLYVRFHSDATAQVKDVDVRDLLGSRRILSLNPFSKSFGIQSRGSKLSAIENLLNSKAAEVVQESLGVVDVLLRLWGEKLKFQQYSVVADFVSHSWEETGYFMMERPNVVEGETHVVIDPRRQYLISGRSADLTGVLMEHDASKPIGADAIFIKAEPRRAEPDYRGGYLSGLHYGLEEYACLQYVMDVERRLVRSAEEISDVFTRKKISSRKSLSILVAQSLSLNLIDERIDALKNSDHWFENSYRDTFQKRIALLEERFGSLRGKIQRRRDQSHDEVQLTQLRWTKRNAWLLVVLALVQIGIAIIVVDWTESGRTNNIMFKNWGALVSSLYL